MKLGIPSALLLTFIILKLCNVIQWSWVWVLSPIWIGFVFFFLVGIIIAIIYKVVE